MEQQPQEHLLVVTYPAQGHINPGRNLAKRIARTTGARVTFSTALSAHRRMFPSSSSSDQEVDDGLVTYIPFDDGFDQGYYPGISATDYMNKSKTLGSQNLTTIVESLAARGRPVTCMIYTLLLSWVMDVAHNFGVPSVLYWIQPASVFAVYYHYFHGYENLIYSHRTEPMFNVNLPGLPPLRIRDIPSFLISSADDPFYVVIAGFRELFQALDREAGRKKLQRVLVNTFDALEPEGLAHLGELNMIAIGPLLPQPSTESKDSKDNEIHGELFEPDEKKYMEWLDTQSEGSVVYVSFGSLSTMKKEQLEEMSRGLAESERPYLWVVRKNNGVEGVELEKDGGKGMVVGWCSQVRVLSHKAVGCFVTHCGWNSSLESLACGVPMIGVPQWTDQGTNARLVEDTWGTGVRAETNAEGVLEGAELRRCLDLVMGEEERGAEMRRRAAMWRDRALEAVKEGGSSDRNLRAFVDEMTTK